MKHFNLILSCLAAFPTGSYAQANDKGEQRPNIIYIFPDQSAMRLADSGGRKNSKSTAKRKETFGKFVIFLTTLSLSF